MLSEKINGFFAPINDVLLELIPYIVAVLFVVIVYVMFKKFINYIVFKLHKKDVHRSTNKWWSWEEYENEKKTQV